MVDEPVHNKVNGFKDVASGFFVIKFNIRKLNNFAYKIKISLPNGFEYSAVAIICFALILSKENEPNLMRGIVEEFLLKSELETLESNLKPGGFRVDEILIHRRASINRKDNRLLVHT